jgi:uncharacterized protein (TIGR04255 family)
MPVQLGPSPLEHLADAPLQLAVVQVRYAPILRIEQGAEVARFQEILGNDYELASKESTAVVSVFVGDEAIEHPQPPSAETLWRFSHASVDLTISLSPSALGFEATEYRDFEWFVGEYGRVVDALADVFEPQSQKRLGVRYINEIKDPRVTGEQIGELIKPAWIAPLLEEDLGHDVARSLSEWRFQQSDGLLVVRNGLVDSDTYLLDFDYYSEETLDFDPTDIRARVTSYHEMIEAIFVWSLHPDFLAELRAKEAER